MKMFKILGISLLAALACLTVIATFDVAPSSAAVGYDNWTQPYNQYWGNSTLGNGGTFTGCAVSWGQSSCIISENISVSNSLGVCATAWGNSRCVAPGR
ncbi:MAG: hypothetical protein WB588_05190 [Dehalococcoidia bacterium]